MYNVNQYIRRMAEFMRVSREQAAANREKILSTAAKLFREKGFDGVGVADLMKEAGLTHGGFYGHFSSKEDLMAQACARAVDELLDAGKKRSETSTDDPFTCFVKNYLSINHRDNTGAGCLMAALGSEAARQNPTVREAFTLAAKRCVNALVEIIPGHTRKKRREQALITLSMLVGAQVIARAVNDEEMSREMLELVLKQVKIAS